MVCASNGTKVGGRKKGNDEGGEEGRSGEREKSVSDAQYLIQGKRLGWPEKAREEKRSVKGDGGG